MKPALLLLAAVSAFATLPAVADDPIDELLLLNGGEFEMGNGESKVILDSKIPVEYRVCATKGPDSVPLVIHYDEKDTVLKLGDCTNLKAKFIRLEPGAGLEEDEVLMGKFTRAR
ncbi:hypothetical protein [Povalibacter sp.]|uniref:hypothetical protein n=1 Tax=Povalibacter sp. TaxID=1962978 RepID=UPI002F42A2A3